MSTPGASQPPEGEKAEGFAKVMKRVRTVLKRGRTKRASTSGPGEGAKSTSKPGPSDTAERYAGYFDLLHTVSLTFSPAEPPV